MLRIRWVCFVRVKLPVERAPEHAAFIANDANAHPVRNQGIFDAMNAEEYAIARVPTRALPRLELLTFEVLFRVGDKGLRFAGATNEITKLIVITPKNLKSKTAALATLLKKFVHRVTTGF